MASSTPTLFNLPQELKDEIWTLAISCHPTPGNHEDVDGSTYTAVLMALPPQHRLEFAAQRFSNLEVLFRKPLHIRRFYYYASNATLAIFSSFALRVFSTFSGDEEKFLWTHHYFVSSLPGLQSVLLGERRGQQLLEELAVSFPVVRLQVMGHIKSSYSIRTMIISNLTQAGAEPRI
ncbi:hypothetical protein LTR97_001045 [Elasticomyces elasticus]|uniref:Uncharacterized protein n=1 Tax=Elasticomyces elasticus TaxID=574655 RepID=A0AAN8A5M9_9PEZI|nr:hypothetical protein LTR97_001045 [Elasticomyces elasticus]